MSPAPDTSGPAHRGAPVGVEKPRASAPARPRLSAELLDRVIFLLLLAVLCARPLISEAFERIELGFLPAGARGPSPAAVVCLDLLLLSAAVLGWISQRPAGWRPGLVTLGLGLLLVAVVVSTAAADNRRVAANAGAHLFVTAAAACVLAGRMPRRWMVHLLVAAVLASGLTNALKCATQRAWELDETLAYWQEQKAQLAEAGVDVEAPAVVNYERRLRSREAFGYLAHPNVTGSCLMMCLLVGGGALVGVVRRRGLDLNQRAATALVATTICALLAAGLWLTGSLGALLAAALGAVLLMPLGIGATTVGRRPRVALVPMVLVYCALIAVGGAYGLSRGTLPHKSLGFRWQYWQAAAKALTDKPLTGIGRENFRAAYLRYKPPQSTEEVANPHNLWVTLAVELGPAGLLGAALLILGVLRRGLTAFGQPGGDERDTARGTAATVAVFVLLVQALFSGEQFGAPGVPLLWATLVAGAWLLAFAASHLIVRQATAVAAGHAWFAAGLNAALWAALVHNLIGFALFTPAGLALFAALAAAAGAGTRSVDQSYGRIRRHLLPLRAAGGAVSVAAYLWVVALPTLRVEAALERTWAAVRVAPDPAAAVGALERGLTLLAADRWETRAALDLGEAALEIAEQAHAPRVSAGDRDVRLAALRLAGKCVAVAERRGTASFQSCRLRARIAETRAELTADPALLEQAAETWRAAVSYYPTNPRARISAGLAAFRVWRRNRNAYWADEARRQLEAALAIDATRPAEVADRLRPAELAQVRELLAALEP